MTNPKWKPRDRKAKIARLTEECGEVLQHIGKIGRFGLDTRYCKERRAVVEDPNVESNVESNREALMREIRDLQNAATAALEELA